MPLEFFNDVFVSGLSFGGVGDVEGAGIGETAFFGALMRAVEDEHALKVEEGKLFLKEFDDRFSLVDEGAFGVCESEDEVVAVNVIKH